MVILPVRREKNKGTAHCALRPVKPKPRLNSLRSSVRNGLARGIVEESFKSSKSSSLALCCTHLHYVCNTLVGPGQHPQYTRAPSGEGCGWAIVSGTVSGTVSRRSSIRIIAMFRTVAVLVFCVYLSGVA